MTVRNYCWLVLALMLSVSSAFAGPVEDVSATMDKWATAFGEMNPDKITALYAKDAVFWGTSSPVLRATPDAIKDYFVSGSKGRTSASVVFGERLIRVYGNTANSTGSYTFSFVQGGETRTVPARYSFTYRKDGNDWLIVDHHSSAVPAPPK